MSDIIERERIVVTRPSELGEREQTHRQNDIYGLTYKWDVSWLVLPQGKSCYNPVYYR
jgi:hypothetical protein